MSTPQIPTEPLTTAGGTLPELFATNVFGLAKMRERLPKAVLDQLLTTIGEGACLEPSVADMVANAMKDWAIEKGATHYCHWFQPLTGLTASKHESFISPTPDGSVLMEFSGKDLTRGEPDASSFPSGSLRESFEARGYTCWDYTSPVFVKQDGSNSTLYIPSAFCSYTGEALDYKTPLLRGAEALNRQALRVLRLLGNTTTRRVVPTFGIEQEYFLIERRFIEQRLDLMQTGRTLFGNPSPRSMAMSVHYLGWTPERVSSFMNELNTELWTLGVSAKTQHNEISPCQYEIVPVFAPINLACDHNQLIMETLQKVAERYDLECLLHAKPFADLGGSGKHLNWSLATDDGVNLLDPGKTPHDNEVFLVFLCALLRAVDRNAALLRASIGEAGNDLRLGAMEAPPAIISVFLGDQLDDILAQLADGGAHRSKKGGEIRLGVSTLPPLPKDVTDRNRTSPFAFTGDRFEFRTAGSSLSVSWPGFVLCTVVADVLREIADELEKASDVNETAQHILHRIACEHRRIVFNGDNYGQDWVDEAARRGLPNLHDTVDAYTAISTDEVVALFERNGILSPDEFQARLDTTFQHYAQCILIEGRTAISVVRRQILPAAMQYSVRVAAACNSVKEAGASVEPYATTLDAMCTLAGKLQDGLAVLESAVSETQPIENHRERAEAARDRIIPAMATLREAVDGLECIVDADLWPLPTYAEMVYRR